MWPWAYRRRRAAQRAADEALRDQLVALIKQVLDEKHAAKAA